MKKTIATIALLLFTTLFNSVISQTSSGESFAITNATIIDVERSQQIENRTILIENGIIKSILHSDSVSLEWIERIVDVNGSYIIPGLIDSHVHLFRPKNRNDILSELLYSGVTAVRDMGGDARMYQSLNQEISKGNLMGPDIYYSANVFGPTFLKDPRTKFAALGFEPGSAPWMRLITEETDLTRVVIDAKEAGVTGLKVYSNVNPELLLKLSEIARENGLKMWSHSSVFPSRPSDAVKAQVDVLSHSVGMIFELEENMPASFNEAIRESVPLQDFKNTDAIASEFLSLFEEMKSRNVIFEPTLSAWETQERTQVSEISSQNQKENPTKHLSGAAERLDPKALNDWAYRITKTAYQNGVTIAAGTDFNLSIKWVQDEIILLTESGLSNIDAIKAATLNNAKAIGIEHTHGSIAVGKTANLVVLSGNPLENIEHIRTVVSVFKNGKEYKKTQ
ncbi:amidohydrolase family protein [Gracilimonas sediminicola]|uniref:Amidohydrolase family protein n=1 Tax=Gracilimonas sediminicola TaxID=2952158 RepID=A0A9X2L5A5_9BACT|nr:amidohydrolase family protein [Gracilimonas sediminicola]MCP9292621.1 amidohydrolase family protein [Gracilimonas sediminicola]